MSFTLTDLANLIGVPVRYLQCMRYHLPVGTLIRRWTYNHATMMVDWSMPFPSTKPVTYDLRDILTTTNDGHGHDYFIIELPSEAAPYRFLMVETRLVTMVV